MTATSAATASSVFETRPLKPFGVLAQVRPGTALEDIPSEELEKAVAEHGVIVLRGLAGTPSPSDLERYCGTMGELLEWPFGYVLDVRLVPNAKNYLFTRDRVEFHCDGVFARAEPHYLFFHCVHAPKEGGASLWSDTTGVWEKATREERQWLRGLTCRYRQELTAHYGGDVKLAVVGEHPITGATVLRYAEPVGGVGGNTPEVQSEDGVEDRAQSERLASFMAERLYEEDVCLRHRWQNGDVVLLDNHRLLHGREAFSSESYRHLRRVHVL